MSGRGHYRIMRATIKPIWYEKWDQDDTNQYFNPVLISCRVPHNETVVDVHLSKNSCEIKQPSMLIFSESVRKSRRKFTVCVKPLDFREDIANYLVQWIEILRTVGADRIEFYVKKIEKTAQDVLEWYDKLFKFKLRIIY